MFIVVKDTKLKLSTVQRYCYGGQEPITGVLETELGEVTIVESSDQASAGWLVDRLASGLFFAKDFDTLDEAKEFIADELVLV